MKLIFFTNLMINYKPNGIHMFYIFCSTYVNKLVFIMIFIIQILSKLYFLHSTIKLQFIKILIYYFILALSLQYSTKYIFHEI